MKNSTLYLSIALIGLFSACSNAEKDKQTDGKDSSETVNTDTTLIKTDNAVKLDTNDLLFFKNAAYGGMVEVESSNKILQTTKDPGIIEFAKMMTKDHGDANMKLEKLASSKGYMLPKSLPESKISKINEMLTFKDEGKNEYYILLMIKEHEEAVNIFNLASKSKDKEIAEFANSTLPTLQLHYQHVTKLDTAFRAPRANQGDDPLKLSTRKKH